MTQTWHWHCYLLDGAQAGIAGHRQVQVDACGQQKIHLDVLVLPLGPEFRRAVNAWGHPAHCLATTCKKGKTSCAADCFVFAQLCAGLCRKLVCKRTQRKEGQHSLKAQGNMDLSKNPIQCLWATCNYSFCFYFNATLP